MRYRKGLPYSLLKAKDVVMTIFTQLKSQCKARIFQQKTDVSHPDSKICACAAKAETFEQIDVRDLRVEQMEILKVLWYLQGLF